VRPARLLTSLPAAGCNEDILPKGCNVAQDDFEERMRAAMANEAERTRARAQQLLDDGEPMMLLPHLAAAMTAIAERTENLGDSFSAMASFLEAVQKAALAPGAAVNPSMELPDLAALAGKHFARPAAGGVPYRWLENFYAWCVEHGHLTQAEARRLLADPLAERN